MRIVSRSSGIVIGVENIPAMTTTAHAIINDERHDKGAGGKVDHSNVLCPTLLDHARTTDSTSSIAPIAT
jgi:hypothetical protein